MRPAVVALAERVLPAPSRDAARRCDRRRRLARDRRRAADRHHRRPRLPGVAGRSSRTARSSSRRPDRRRRRDGAAAGRRPRIDATGKWVTPGLINALDVARRERGRRGGVDASTPRPRARPASPRRSACGTASIRPPCCGRRRATRASRRSVAVPAGGLVAGQAALLDSLGDTRDGAGAARAGGDGRRASAPRPPRPSRAASCCCDCAQLLDDARTYGAKRVAYERGGDADVRRLAASISRRCSRCWRGGCRCSSRSIAPPTSRRCLDLARGVPAAR